MLKFTQLNMTRFGPDHGAKSWKIELAEDEILGVCLIDKDRHDHGREAWLALKSGVRVLIASREFSPHVHSRVVGHMLADKKITKETAAAKAEADKARDDKANADLLAVLLKYPQLTCEQIVQIPTWLTLDKSHPHHIEQYVDQRRHK